MPLFPLTLLAAWFLAAPTDAAPKITYLRCDFGSTSVFVTTDEANSLVTVSLPSTGFTRRAAAAFTANGVRFDIGNVSYEISRVDLTAVRSVPIINRVDTAKCVVETPGPRAF